MKQRSSALPAPSAFTFVLMMGVVNLFADMTYEGGASINGPFLGTLGPARLRSASSPGYAVLLISSLLALASVAAAWVVFPLPSRLEEGGEKTALATGFTAGYLGYGGGWLAGSVATGLLYERSRRGLIVFAVAVLLASAPFFVLAARHANGNIAKFRHAKGEARGAGRPTPL